MYWWLDSIYSPVVTSKEHPTKWPNMKVNDLPAANTSECNSHLLSFKSGIKPVYYNRSKTSLLCNIFQYTYTVMDEGPGIKVHCKFWSCPAFSGFFLELQCQWGQMMEVLTPNMNYGKLLPLWHCLYIVLYVVSQLKNIPVLFSFAVKLRWTGMLSGTCMPPTWVITRMRHTKKAPKSDFVMFLIASLPKIPQICGGYGDYVLCRIN